MHYSHIITCNRYQINGMPPLDFLRSPAHPQQHPSLWLRHNISHANVSLHRNKPLRVVLSLEGAGENCARRRAINRSHPHPSLPPEREGEISARWRAMKSTPIPIPTFGYGITLAMRMLAFAATSRCAACCPLRKPSPSPRRKSPWGTRGGQGGDGV